MPADSQPDPNAQSRARDPTESAVGQDPADAGPDASAAQNLSRDATADLDAARQAPDLALTGKKFEAIGRARRSQDVDLARRRAASKATAKLLKNLKQKGIVAPETDKLEGVTIERYWRKRGFVYAKAIFFVKNTNSPLNESNLSTSNPSEARHQSASPKGDKK